MCVNYDWAQTVVSGMPLIHLSTSSTSFTNSGASLSDQKDPQADNSDPTDRAWAGRGDAAGGQSWAEPPLHCRLLLMREVAAGQAHGREEVFASAPPASAVFVKALCASLIRSDVTVRKEGLSSPALIRASCLEGQAEPSRVERAATGTGAMCTAAAGLGPHVL